MHKTTIVTHNGKFHADDVFGVATLILVLGDVNVEIIRTRDPEIIKKGDYVLDVGNEYKPERNRFDHHQQEGAGVRENGIPYASFGLIWKSFGTELCISDKVVQRIDKKLVQGIDATDNGVEMSDARFTDVFEYSLNDIVASYRPTWKEVDLDFDEQFLKAVTWAQTVIEREITIATDWIEGEKIVEQAYREAEDKRLIIVENTQYHIGRELSESVLINYPEPLYVVLYRHDVKNWQVVAVSAAHRTFKHRKDLPETWAGKRDTELAEVTGVPDAVFCHRNLFMAVAKSKEGALKLAHIALEN